MKKFVVLFALLSVMLVSITGCKQPAEPEKHICETNCEYCGKCLNSDCTEEVCNNKCTEVHIVAQFNGAYNLYASTYIEVLQYLYSDGTTTLYQVRDGSNDTNKSEYYGNWSKNGSTFSIEITKRLPDGKTSVNDQVDYVFSYSTEAGLGSEAIYFLDIIATANITRSVLMYKKNTVTDADANVWLNARYSNATPSDVILSEGNNDRFNLENVAVLPTNSLTGKKICYLGSSVTYGSASECITFAEYIDKRNNTISEKYAVSGTMLVDNGANSYVSRLKKIETSKNFDLFICQLSTNDASNNRPLGTISTNGEYDTSTVCGAIEFIINYVKETWNCPVVFYTNSYYENANYAAMVTLIKQVAEKYGIGLIDLYSDAEFNDISAEERFLYMSDSIHPYKAGYLEWWTPKFEEYLLQYFNKQ